MEAFDDDDDNDYDGDYEVDDRDYEEEVFDDDFDHHQMKRMRKSNAGKNTKNTDLSSHVVKNYNYFKDDFLCL